MGLGVRKRGQGSEGGITVGEEIGRGYDGRVDGYLLVELLGW